MLRIHRAEALAGAITIAVTAAALLLALVRGAQIDFASFAGQYLAAGGLLAGGAFYRRSGRAPGIALTLIACALFILFSNAGAILNYLMIRPGTPPIDGLLFRADAALGFDWRDFAHWVSQWPAAGPALASIYRSSLAQLALVIVVLGFGQRRVDLHRFLLTGMICSCASIAIWCIWPSLSVSSHVVLDPATEARLGRILGPGYGAQMLELLRNGPGPIAADRMLGLISFPSMHTVMAAMVVWYARRTIAFAPLALLNLAMLPAILIHGSHYLVDVIGGLLLFAAAAIAVRRIVPDRPESLEVGAVPAPQLSSTPLPAAGS